LYPRKNGPTPRYYGGSTTLGQELLACWGISVWDNLWPKLEVFGPKIDRRPKAEIGFRK
jgi:hypothetical protein